MLAGVSLFRDQMLHDFRRARQTTGMGSEDTLRHVLLAFRSRARLRRRARHKAATRNSGRPACAIPGSRRTPGNPWYGSRPSPIARKADSAVAFHVIVEAPWNCSLLPA